MSFSIYQASVPAVVKILSNFLTILDKADAYCTAKKVDPAVLLNSRLYPDMFPFVRQVQIATDQAKGMAARLACDASTVIDDARINCVLASSGT